MRMRLSVSAEASCLSPLIQVTALTCESVLVWVRRAPSRSVHTRIVLSTDPEQSFALLGENLSEVTAASWPERTLSCLPPARSQSWITPLLSANASHFPLPLTAMTGGVLLPAKAK